MGTPTTAEQAPAPPQKISHDRLTLTALLVALVAPFRGQSDPRWYLNGINVRPHPAGGAIIAATNGHMLGAVHDRAATCDHEITLTIHPATVAACAARPRDNRQLKMLNGRLAVVAPEGEVCIQPGNPEITGSLYPRYETLLPDVSRLTPGLIGPFQAKYLAILDQAAKVAHGAKGTARAVTFYTIGATEGAPAIARIPAAPDFVAVLMPVHAEESITPMPAWVASAKKHADSATPAKEAA